MKEKLIIVGTSTTASYLYEFIKEYELFDIVGFAVNKQYMSNDTFMGEKVYAIEKLDNYFDKSEIKVFVALLWNRLNADRRDVYLQLKAQGYSFANVVSPTAKVYGKIMGDNCWLQDYVVMLPFSQIGTNNILMQFTTLGVEASLGSHCFCGTKATILGKCSIGDQAFVGTNSIIFDTRTIGNKCIIGAGVSIKRDLPDNSTVKLASETYITKQFTDDQIESKLLFAKTITK